MNDLITVSALSVLIVAFGVGIVVGLTGMGGGALMTPALIFLGVNPTAAVANDLVAASINKSVGASVHWRRGTPNLKLAGLLIVGSVPFAFAGGFIVQSVGGSEEQASFLTTAIGYALLFTAAHLRAADVSPAALRHRRQRDERGRAEGARPPDHPGRRRGWPPRGDHVGRLGLAHHGGPAADLPDPVRRTPRRHRPGAGCAVGARGRHRARGHRRRHLGGTHSAGPRRYAGHLPGREDGGLGLPVGDPPRHRHRAHPDGPEDARAYPPNGWASSGPDCCCSARSHGASSARPGDYLPSTTTPPRGGFRTRPPNLRRNIPQIAHS